MRLAKQTSGFVFKRQHSTRLWQTGYYEHVLRAAERTEEIVEYIVANPVRGKLAENPADYPYWGSSVYTRDEILRFVGDGFHRRAGEHGRARPI